MTPLEDFSAKPGSSWGFFWRVFFFIHLFLLSTLVWLRVQRFGPATLRILPADIIAAIGLIVCAARSVYLYWRGRRQDFSGQRSLQSNLLQAAIFVGLCAYYYVILFLAILPVGR